MCHGGIRIAYLGGGALLHCFSSLHLYYTFKLQKKYFCFASLHPHRSLKTKK
nr:MAG TPA: hypothetical protein [Caudoviricetes sp.]